jgi:ferredoxin-fold anticodon binding domain-containing protein
MEQIIDQAVLDNQLLTLELNTFRIFSQDLVKQLRAAKAQERVEDVKNVVEQL